MSRLRCCYLRPGHGARGRADANAGQPGALEHQGIDGHQRRAAGHGERRHFRTDGEGVEHSCSHWKRNDVIGHGPPQVLMHLAQRSARQLDRADDIERIAFHQHHVGAFDRHIGSSADGEADIGLRQRRCIVDAVAHHADPLSLRLQLLDLGCLVTGQHVGQHDVDADLAGDALRRRPVVAGQHGHLHAPCVERRYGGC